MSAAESALLQLAKAHGVYADYHDLHGVHNRAEPDTLRALLAALGVDAQNGAVAQDALAQLDARRAARLLPEEHIAYAGRTSRLYTARACSWALLSEDGRAVVAEGNAQSEIALPALEAGYYLLCAAQGEQTRVLVRPDRAPDVARATGQAKCWGVTGALYGLRSNDNGGLGTYRDLGRVCTTLGQTGAQFFGINPVHALGWAAQDMISPYSPTHRGFFNIDHIATEDGLGPAPDQSLVDYAPHRARHRAALERDYQTFLSNADTTEFNQWCTAEGNDLVAFSQFEAISETHGPDFRTWPAELRAPGRAAQSAAGARAAFHAWLQWRAQQQIAQAQSAARGSGAMALGLYLDLAVGPRPGGSEVWMNAATIAKGVSVGAPPDHLSPAGQSWALAAHAPAPLSETFYAPLRRMLRALMQRCGLLRIDHALGLLRSFWLPDDGSPGGYVSQPFESLLAVITIEADRAGCVVIGEDLGLVPDGFRAQMGASGLYSYAVWQYEAGGDGHVLPPSALPAYALGCFGTHDTPTLQGFWHGNDIEWWHRVGWISSGTALQRHGQRAQQRQDLRRLCGLGPMATATQIGAAIHATLATAPCAMLTLQLDDVLGEIEAQNLPGTIDAHPNWRRRTREAVEHLAALRDIQAMNEMMPQDRKTHRAIHTEPAPGAAQQP